MNNIKKHAFRISGATILVIGLGLAGCAGPQYTAAPPSEKLSYMGIEFEKGIYGGPWYGPAYQAPRIIVTPTIPDSE
ncbi:MAG: hypothetical protein HOH58_02740 [Opitutaceae bacterium]|jgi:hypothetical protein|nr:hypothetical protein [Opitutaceae bacterium]